MIRLSAVEIVIPVHNSSRPIERAVRSILASKAKSLTVTVVCHNLSSSEVLIKLQSLQQDARLQLLGFSDGVPSAAGPRNFAIAKSTADYLAFLDSDDEFEAGALDAWISELREDTELHIGQLSSDGAGRIAAPAPRSGRLTGLHPVADLLNYRTAPMGALISRSLITRSDSPRYRDGLTIGEDIALGAFLWNYSAKTTFSRYGGGYRIHEDGADRVTGGLPKVAVVLQPVQDALQVPALQALPLRNRQALAAKLLRYQVLEFVKGRVGLGPLDQDAAEVIADTIAGLLRFAPGALGYFDRYDARSIDALRARDMARFSAAAKKAEAAPHQLKAIALNPLRSLAPEALFVKSRRVRNLHRSFR